MAPKTTQKQTIQEFQTHFGTILDHAQTLVFIKDLDGRFLYANKSFIDLTGLTKKKVIGHFNHDIFPAELAERLDKSDKLLIKNEEIQHKRDPAFIHGVDYEFRTIKLPLYDDEGNFVAIGGLSNNMTQVRDQQRQIDTSQDLLKLVLENIPDNVTVRDEEARIIDVSKAFIESFSGTPKQDILDGSVFSHKPEKRAPDSTETVTQEKAGYSSFEDSNEIRLDTKEIDFKGPDDSHYLISISSDITEQVEEEETLEKLYTISRDTSYDLDTKMQESLKIICDFLNMEIGNISHIEDEIYTVVQTHNDQDQFQKGDQFKLKDTLCEVVHNHQSIQAWHDLGDSDKKGHSVSQKFGIKSHIGAPIFHEGRVYGTLGFTSTHKKDSPFTSRQRNVVKILSQIISYEIAVHNVIRQLEDKDQRYELSALASKSIMWDWDTKTDQLSWAGQSYVILGYDNDHELPATSLEFFEELLHPDDRELVKGAFTEHFKNKTPINLEARAKAKSGDYIWFIAKAQAQWDEDGFAEKVFGSMTSISEQKEMQIALRESEQKFKIAYNNSPMGIAIVGLDGAFLDVNPEICNILGYDKDELMEMSFQEITHPDDLDKDLIHTEKLKKREISNYQTEKKYLHKDGHVIWALVKVGLAWDDDQNPLYFIPQLIDITARKEALENERQSHKMAALGQLAGGIAHELNNLLQPALMGAEMIAKRLPDDADKDLFKYVDLIVNSSLKSSEIIDDVLAFSRLDSGSRTVLPIAKSALEACEFSKELLPKTVTINLNGFEDAGGENARINNSDFTRIMTNLMVNAYHAGGPKVRIDVDYELLNLKEADAGILNLRAGLYAKISFADNGSGIPLEVMDHVFDPFFTTKDNEGTGLGLPIVYGIIQNWHGTITIESKVGTGTSFFIYIPVHEDSSEEYSI